MGDGQAVAPRGLFFGKTDLLAQLTALVAGNVFDAA